MATAPTSIRVLVLLADGSDLVYKTFGTVREEIKPPTLPAEIYDLVPEDRESVYEIWQRWVKCEASHHMVIPGWQPSQPDISLLPKIAEDDWPAAAWEKRGVVGSPKWHLLFTTYTERDLKTNPWVGRQVSGDVFVLWISDTADADGRRFYVDLKPEHFNQEAVLLGIALNLKDVKRMVGRLK